MRSPRTTRVILLATALTLLAVLSVPLASIAQTSLSSSLLVKLIGGLTPDQQAQVIARNGGIEISSIPALRLHVIQVAPADLAQVLASYQADPQVANAEENKTRQSQTFPADPLYPNQWSLPKIGWDVVFGTVTPSGSVIVAVLDTGIDAQHPDLAGNVIPGTSILDGFSGTTDPSGHGTWMAGIVAARTDVAPLEGIAGVAYAGVRVMPVTVLDVNGLGQDSDVIAGVIWAADHGADVIVMAFSSPGFSQNLQDAIDYAWSKNVVLVAATGNDALNAPTFPAGDRGVMGVSGTDPSDTLVPFSSYGQSVFIAAPATDIQTTEIGDAYSVISGTSASAAIVAGAAAFMKAVDPTLTNGIIVGRLARMADPAGTQDQTGNGRINMARALLDTGTDFIQPAGAAPVGGGGPFVGPYGAAALSITPTVGTQTGTLTYGVGGQVTYTVTISSNGNGSQTTTPSVSGLPSGATGTFSPSGSVTCNSANTPPCTVSSFTLTVTTLNTTAAGTTNFTVSVDKNATGTLTIGKLTSTTTLTSNINPSLAGQSLTFTATVSGAGPTPPSGSVTFRDGGANINCNNVALSGAQATCTISTLSIGSHSITATYSNDTNYNGSSDTLTQIVRRATSTAVTSNNNPSTFGQSVTFTATVTGTGAGAGNPGSGDGMVAFSDAATPITGCDAQPLNASGQATCPTSALAAGSHTINAAYSGTTTGATQFAPSSGSVAQTVNKAATTTTAASKTATFSTTDQTVTLTATVTSGAGTVNQGSVTFTVKDGATVIGSTASGSVASGGASASYTLPGGSGARTYTIETAYTSGPTGNFADSSDNTKTLTVSKAGTTTTAADKTATFSTTDQTVTLTATVTTGAGTVNQGSVTFTVKDGATVIGSTALGSVASGGASASYTLPGGSGARTYTIEAAYTSEPTGNFADSSDNTKTLKVNAALVTVNITGGPFTYDGSLRAATVTTTPSITGYSVNYTGTTTYNSSTPPTNADTYTVTVTITDPNYLLSGSGTGSITIKKLTVSVTPTAGQYKIYGVGDPTLSYTSAPALVGTDTFSGALSRDAGTNVGLYDITQGTLALSPNYTLVFSAGVQFEIKKLTVSVTPTAGQYKIYGVGDPTLSYTSAPALVGTDTFSGTLAHDVGENVGLYNITQGTLALSPNYMLAFTAGVKFEIRKKNASVAPNNNSKILGEPDPVPLTTGTLSGFLPADGVTATYSRVAGEMVGTTYTITAALSPDAVLGNYNITYNTANFTIIYNWTGFFQPIDNQPVVNVVKAGSAIPVKFSLHGNQGLTIFISGSPASGAMACNSTDPASLVDETVTAGGSSLTYDSGADHYIYVWKTEKAWTGCRQLGIQLKDGSYHRANFQFK